MLPKINMLARLTREPEIRYAQDGKMVCTIGLACSEKYADKETQFFIDATAFGKTAEFLNNVKKGQRVYVSGKLKTDKWVSQDGQNKNKIAMTIESFEYVEARDDSNNQQQPQQHQDNQQNQAQQNYAPHQGQQQSYHPQQIYVNHLNQLTDSTEKLLLDGNGNPRYNR